MFKICGTGIAKSGGTFKIYGEPVSPSVFSMYVEPESPNEGGIEDV